MRLQIPGLPSDPSLLTRHGCYLSAVSIRIKISFLINESIVFFVWGVYSIPLGWVLNPVLPLPATDAFCCFCCRLQQYPQLSSDGTKQKVFWSRAVSDLSTLLAMATVAVNQLPGPKIPELSRGFQVVRYDKMISITTVLKAPIKPPQNCVNYRHVCCMSFNAGLRYRNLWN